MAHTVEKKASVKNGVLRLVFAILAVLLEIIILVFLVTKLHDKAEWLSIGMRVLASALVIAIYSEHKTASMKMPWILFIMIMPAFGAALFLMTGLSGATRKMRNRYKKIDDILLPYLKQDSAILEQLDEKDKSISNISRYLISYCRYPLYANTEVVYYSEAKDAIEAQKQAMRQAEKFIFMEYHAIEDATIWHEILEILEERVKAGVEVRVFYDDLGSIGFINTDFVNRMKEKHIACRVFNPFVPGINLFLNNRDHRKITVVDGKIGFTGGYNLANEYFNIVQPYGYWKDTGVKLTGEAVMSMTATFLEMWNAVREKDIDDESFEQYLTVQEKNTSAEGLVHPYADSPIDGEQVGENVYISLIQRARDYIWFTTPYLIITDEMIHALGMAAKRGVDVRIITPGIPDKRIVYSVTRSYYNALTRNGVRIYEYTPGFCHCKMCVSDDILATCGTINLDYRSLYHHFENGCIYYDCQAVADTKKDFEEIMAQSRDVTEQYTTGRKTSLRFGQLILRLFAPLL